MKKKELNVTPTVTEMGSIYLSWDLIEAIRKDEKWHDLVTEVVSVTHPHPHIAVAAIHLKYKGEILASAAAACEWNDEINGKKIGSRYVSAAVTKAKGAAIADFFGLRNEYWDDEPMPSGVKPSQIERGIASIVNKLHEQTTERSDSQEPVPGK